MDCKIVILIISTVAAYTDTVDCWGYSVSDGPSTWGASFPKCNGNSQSPIDIQTTNAVINYSLPVVPRSHFYDKPTALTLSNNGHAFVAAVTDGGYTINDAKLLPFPAKIAQYHFHWGTATTSGTTTTTTGGSEHTLNSRQYFGELHAVHFNTKYASLSEAAAQSDGLAVFGWFVDVTYPQTNQDMKHLLALAAANAQLNEESGAVAAADLFSLETILPPNLDVYYRYKGSLTTPTCDESVIWTVFKSPIEITPAQAAVFTTSFYETTTAATLLVNNFRPVQNLNGREVTMPPALVQESGAGAVHPSVLLGLITCAIAQFL